MQMRSISPRILAVTAALILALGVPSGTGVASAAEPADVVPSMADAENLQPSPYVQASSPEDALEKLTALESSGRASVANVRYGPCTLYPSVMYLRASSNYGAVGSKPYTRCTVAVSSIKHKTDVRYKSFIWWRLATSKSGGNYGTASYTQKNVEYYCKSRESTAWSGTTLGTIVYGGRTYYARVYQPVKTLNCGG